MLFNIEILVNNFIEAYLKIGIKHNIVTQILDFKQNGNEIISKCLDRFQKYVSRCPFKEILSVEHVMSCFLEGLKNTTLHAPI